MHIRDESSQPIPFLVLFNAIFIALNHRVSLHSKKLLEGMALQNRAGTGILFEFIS